MDRREAIKTIFLTGASTLLAARSGFAQAKNEKEQFWESFWSKPRSLHLTRPESGEYGVFHYWDNGLITDEYEKLCWLLRDIRAEVSKPIDLELLNLICGVTGWLSLYGFNKPFVVHSGYRSEKTNSQLEGAAKNSMHLQGRAIDGRIEGLSAEYLGKVFAAFKTGGVGFYVNRQHDFIHADTGRIRYWLRK